MKPNSFPVCNWGMSRERSIDAEASNNINMTSATTLPNFCVTLSQLNDNMHADQ